jgi:hypothetical protein
MDLFQIINERQGLQERFRGQTNVFSTELHGALKRGKDYGVFLTGGGGGFADIKSFANALEPALRGVAHQDVAEDGADEADDAEAKALAEYEAEYEAQIKAEAEARREAKREYHRRFPTIEERRYQQRLSSAAVEELRNANHPNPFDNDALNEIITRMRAEHTAEHEAASERRDTEDTEVGTAAHIGLESEVSLLGEKPDILDKVALIKPGAITRSASFIPLTHIPSSQFEFSFDDAAVVSAAQKIVLPADDEEAKTSASVVAIAVKPSNAKVSAPTSPAPKRAPAVKAKADYKNAVFNTVSSSSDKTFETVVYKDGKYYGSYKSITDLKFNTKGLSTISGSRAGTRVKLGNYDVVFGTLKE